MLPSNTTAQFDFAAFLQQFKPAIIAAWVDRLHTQSGGQYAQRPLAELISTVTEAFESNYQVLVHDNYIPVDQFIAKITRLRLAAGFSLAAVQQAFELFREIAIPLLAPHVTASMVRQTIVPINHCLAYTIHRFSEHFQAMHEKTIREHNLHLEQLVAERTAALIESERMATIGQITTSLSHEIRNPLSAVKMNLQILHKKLALSGNDHRRLEISLEEVMRLEGILKELLDFAKPLRIQPACCNINEVLRFAIELLDIRFEERHIRLIRLLEPNIPTVWGDAEKLEQAFINLLLNALEASEAHSTVRVFSRPSEYNCVAGVDIQIQDEGHGIQPEAVHHIFDPFFTTKSRGTGLGLTNTRRIVAAHNGIVEFTRRDGPGVSFRIWIPAARPR